MGVVQRSGVRVAQRSGMVGVGQRHGRMPVGGRMAVGIRSGGVRRGDVRRAAQVAGGDGGEQQRKNALQTTWEWGDSVGEMGEMSTELLCRRALTSLNMVRCMWIRVYGFGCVYAQ